MNGFSPELRLSGGNGRESASLEAAVKRRLRRMDLRPRDRPELVGQRQARDNTL
jgi:hypothetical protein